MKRRKLMKEMARYSNELTEENHKLFDKILLTIRFSNLSETDAEEFSHHCLNLFLQAQQEGIPVKRILGTEDIDAFCEEYIEQVYGSYSLLKKILLKVSYIPMILLLFTGFFGMFVNILLPVWIAQKAFTFHVAIPLSLVINTIFAIVVVYAVVNKLDQWLLAWDDMEKKQKRKWTFYLWAGNVLVIATFVLSGFYLRQILFQINVLLFSLVCVFLDRLLDYVSEKIN